MKELQEWAGHSNYNTTANIYAHIQEESKNRLSKTIEKVLFQNSVRKSVRKVPKTEKIRENQT